MQVGARTRLARHHRGRGWRAHLPGVTAAFTTLPVIGVPIESKSLKGLDSLLSIVQMPPGVPVATVGIGGDATPDCSPGKSSAAATRQCKAPRRLQGKARRGIAIKKPNARGLKR